MRKVCSVHSFEVAAPAQCLRARPGGLIMRGGHAACGCCSVSFLASASFTFARKRPWISRRVLPAARASPLRQRSRNWVSGVQAAAGRGGCRDRPRPRGLRALPELRLHLVGRGLEVVYGLPFHPPGLLVAYGADHEAFRGCSTSRRAAARAAGGWRCGSSRCRTRCAGRSCPAPGPWPRG